MIEKIKKYPLVPVFFHPDAEYAENVVRACYAGGIRFFEFTNRGAEAFEVFSRLAEFVKNNCPGMSLGIGTIYNTGDAGRFIAAGADFIVQPVAAPDVGEMCRRYGKPWIPGAMTLNEIWGARQSGADLVKVFPGNVLGPDYIKALRGPLPDVPLMVTGGVEPTEESLREWFGAGVDAVGLGSRLFKGDYSSDFAGLSARISQLFGFLKTMRQ